MTRNNDLLTPPPLDDPCGFIGTVLLIGDIDFKAAEELWEVATKKLAKTYNETRPDVIRNFLRSRHGRHFANSITVGLGWNQTKDCKDALIKGIEISLSDPSHWRKWFDEVKEATIAGEWED